MADGFIGIDLRTSGLDKAIKDFDELPDAVIDAGTEAANEYIVDMERAYVPYRHVTVAESGGWKSEKQRRYVMARIREGTIKIPYRRTQNLRRGWKTLGYGRNQIVVNEVPYAGWVKDIATQTQAHMLRGWEVTANDIRNKLGQIVRKFEAGAKKAIKRLGLA